MKIPGKHVVLRDEELETDEDDLFQWLNLEEWSYYDEPDTSFSALSREDFDKQRDEFRRRPREFSPWQIDTVEGRHIGWISFYHLDKQAKRVYIGVCLPEEETWGRGYGTEALRLILGRLFGRMGLEEVGAATWTGNKRMLRCAEKCGFREVARTPYEAEYSVRGEPLERIEFSISRGEWSALRGSSS